MELGYGMDTPMSNRNWGGRREGAGRPALPGTIVLVKVRVMDDSERDRILALTPRERAERMLAEDAGASNSGCSGQPDGCR